MVSDRKIKARLKNIVQLALNDLELVNTTKIFAVFPMPESEAMWCINFLSGYGQVCIAITPYTSDEAIKVQILNHLTNRLK
jgi:hypothetical protein